MVRTLTVFLTLIMQVSIALSQAGWRELENGPTVGSRHDDLYFITPEIGWVANLFGQVFQTKDGGESWERIWIDVNAGYRSIGFADSLTGWLGAISGPPYLYETDDGGRTWTGITDITGPPINGICGISVVNDSVVFGVGRFDGTPALIKTTDRGANWRSINLRTLAQTLIDCHFFSPDSGFVVGGGIFGSFPNTLGSVILFTKDGGETWDIRHSSSRQGEWCWKISFPNRRIGFVSIEKNGVTSEDQHMLKTVDGGVSWRRFTVGSGFRVQGIGLITDRIGWIGGGRQTHETSNGGVTWQRANIDMENVNRFRFFGDSIGYAVGKRVFKYEKRLATSIDEPETVIPEAMHLHQNFPNPFNPVTTIEFDVREKQTIRLQVFNVKGQLLMTLAEGVFDAGRHQVSLDGQALASGMYLYSLRAGDIIETRKMILMR